MAWCPFEGAGNQEEGKQEAKEEEAERKLLELVSDDDGELELEPEEELTPSEQESLANETRIGRSSRRQLRIYKKLLRTCCWFAVADFCVYYPQRCSSTSPSLLCSRAGSTCFLCSPWISTHSSVSESTSVFGTTSYA